MKPIQMKTSSFFSSWDNDRFSLSVEMNMKIGSNRYIVVNSCVEDNSIIEELSGNEKLRRLIYMNGCSGLLSCLVTVICKVVMYIGR